MQRRPRPRPPTTSSPRWSPRVGRGNGPGQGGDRRRRRRDSDPLEPLAPRARGPGSATSIPHASGSVSSWPAQRLATTRLPHGTPTLTTQPSASAATPDAEPLLLLLTLSGKGHQIHRGQAWDPIVASGEGSWANRSPTGRHTTTRFRPGGHTVVTDATPRASTGRYGLPGPARESPAQRPSCGSGGTGRYRLARSSSPPPRAVRSV
jgi:hypothetical protein